MMNRCWACATVTLVLVACLRAHGAESNPVTNAPPSLVDLQQRLAKAESAIADLQQQVRQADASAGGIRLPGADHLLINGEGGVAWFDNQDKHGSPDSGFRVDEALLFLDVNVFPDVYLFTEIKLRERETIDENVYLGELYVDFENLLQDKVGEGLFNARAGRFDVPFGEEYETRDAARNPLISHSVSDLWGVDEGVEVYGRFAQFDYTVAVQNGGEPSLHDGNSDKAVVGRVGCDPLDALRLSVSAMRTGRLDTEYDKLSAEWFGNAYLGPIGASATTTHFGADLYEADARWHWAHGHLAGAFGYLVYDDNDTAVDNSRNATYSFVEAEQDLVGGLYAATRASQIHAPDGFPLVGQGAYARVLAPPFAETIWRVSAGLGYRWSRNLILKGEYSVEQGKDTQGQNLGDADLAGVEVAFNF